MASVADGLFTSGSKMCEEDVNISDNEFRDISSGSSDNYEPPDTSETTDSDDHETCRKRKTGNPTKWKKNVRKCNRAAGKQYTNSKGKAMPSKNFVDYSCTCKFNCPSKVTLDDKKHFFNLFYNDSQSWETQTSIICGAVKCETIKRRRTGTDESKKQISRTFYLPTTKGDVKVCKLMFMNTLQIVSARVHRALLKKKTLSFSDLRGKHSPHNKTSLAIVNLIKDHINSFPTQKSHYTRTQTTKSYLDTNLNLSLMYRLFVKDIKENNKLQKIPSQSFYEKVFRRDFNLSFKPPRKDTCHKCDNLKIQLQTAEIEKNEEELQKIKSKQELHHRKVQAARLEIKEDDKLSKTELGTTVFSFDLQKVMLLPRLTTGVVYYKRQLSCYNLGVHDFETNTGTMYVWDESVGSRGAQEVGSCVLKHIQMHEHKDRLIAWSDSCGGQNRNIKVAAMWMYIVQCPSLNVKEVIHKFAEPGHSYLPNDSDFGDIERKLKYHPEVYVPTQWYEIIENSRVKKKKFAVVNITKEDIKSTTILQDNMTNRKITESGEKVEWLKIKQMRFTKENPGIMQFKYTHSSDIVDFKSVNLNKRLKGRPMNLGCLELPILYPAGRKIYTLKLRDITSLLEFVPPCHHHFYNQLQTSDGNEEEIVEESEEENTDEEN